MKRILWTVFVGSLPYQVGLVATYDFLWFIDAEPVTRAYAFIAMLLLTGWWWIAPWWKEK